MDSDQEAFQRAAEAIVASAPSTIEDLIAQKREELRLRLLQTIAVAAQAKADLLRASTEPTFRPAVNYRAAEREAQNALHTIIEWESGLL